jgi:hypothetical protein
VAEVDQGRAMTEKRKPRTRRTVRHLLQKHISQDRRDLQRLAERYEASPLFPQPEPQGLYQP